MPVRPDPERRRLVEHQRTRQDWLQWGPYLAERAWGTVREDYSDSGEAWRYFPHDHARSRAYRWNEDSLAGWCDRDQRLCLGLALWNGQDPFLKERLFGLSSHEGNHAEDVKELYWYTDATPTHSLARMRYWYPQARFPYEPLLEGNAARSRLDPELEISDTGVFDEQRFFDVEITYVKASAQDTLMRVEVHNRGPDEATVHVVPQLWFRNTWSWDDPAPTRPCLTMGDNHSITAWHDSLGEYHWYWQGPAQALFTDNDTNHERLHDGAVSAAFTKDALHRAIVNGEPDALNPKMTGTKAGLHYPLNLASGERHSVQLRLSRAVQKSPFTGFSPLVDRRVREADAFYAPLAPASADALQRQVQRQALAGMLWSKQFFAYDVSRWLRADTNPVARWKTRNQHWRHMRAADVLSMPDTWEYPWFAVWDTAFHCLPLAMTDPAFARAQLLLMTSERYQHPNGQLPAYEWAFDDVNPPVHAWSALQVFRLEQALDGKDGLAAGVRSIPRPQLSASSPGKGMPDKKGSARRTVSQRASVGHAFLEEIFHKLLLNFTWWVNRKDAFGHDIFEGGFLGLDNISLFDRSEEPPAGLHLSQADATGWMGFFCANMMNIALELAQRNPAYEPIACKFLEHFLRIAEAIQGSERHPGLWDTVDGFFHDHLSGPGGRDTPIRARSLVGLLPLIACTRIDAATLQALPRFRERLEVLEREAHAGFLASTDDAQAPATGTSGSPTGRSRFLSFASQEQLDILVRAICDEQEFLSGHGIRSMSRVHLGAPCTYTMENGEQLTLRYEPGDGQSHLFGGNSNWRGPVWFPINYLLIEALREYGQWLGPEHRMAFPTGSERMLSLNDIGDEIGRQLIGLFLDGDAESARVRGDYADRPENDSANIGPAPWCGNDAAQIQARAEGLHLFHEFFDGDTGRGLGASHQTGWTGLVALLMYQLG